MLTAALFVAQVLWIVPSAPPASPAEAVAVLRASGSDRDVTGLRLGAPPELPRVLVISRRAERRERPRVFSLAEIPWADRAAVPWKHVAPASEDPTIRTVRVLDDRRATGHAP
jgi:hypothetical protein